MYTFGLAVLLEAVLPLLAPAQTPVSQEPVEEVVVAPSTILRLVDGVRTPEPGGIPPVGFVFTAVEDPPHEHVFGLTEADLIVADLNNLANKAWVYSSIYGHEASYKSFPDLLSSAEKADTAVAASVVTTVQKAMRKGAKLTVVTTTPITPETTSASETAQSEPDLDPMPIEEFLLRSPPFGTYAPFQEEWGTEENGFAGLMNNLPVEFVNVELNEELRAVSVAVVEGECSSFRTIAPGGITLFVMLLPEGGRSVSFEPTNNPGFITTLRYP